MQKEKAAVQTSLGAMRSQAQEVVDLLEPRVGTPLTSSDIRALARFITTVADLGRATDELLAVLEWEK